jgi:DNA invertase Pin-like site-specific DNA recombinase
MLSPEMQEAAIKKLAAAHSDEDVVIFSDLDISGRKGRSARPGWDELLRAVEDGDATSVYAYSLSRFARSVAQLADFFDLCDKRHVRVRVDRDHIDTSTATGKLVGNVLASLAQFEADVASERVKDAFAAKAAKDPEWGGPGQPAYGLRDGEDVADVLDAFRERGSYDGAARLLNEKGIKCRVRGAAWSGTVVRSIIQREAPDEVLPSASRGAPAGKRAFRFASLVRCSTCEARGVRAGSKASTFLTGSWDKRRREVRYACSRSRTMPHARGWVIEAKLMPVIKAEAERAAAAIRRLQVGSAEDEAKLAALAAKRKRVLENFEDGLYEKPERDRRLAEVADEESKLSSRVWVRRATIAPDIETGDPSEVNAYLRRLFSSVVVDMSEPATFGPSKWLPTVAFGWRDESLRDGEEPEAFDFGKLVIKGDHADYIERT